MNNEWYLGRYLGEKPVTQTREPPDRKGICKVPRLHAEVGEAEAQ